MLTGPVPMDLDQAHNNTSIMGKLETHVVSMCLSMYQLQFHS